MLAAPVPPNENARIEALHAYRVLDTPPEHSFERITALATRVFAVPMSLVSLVDKDRQWMKSCIGMDLRESSRDVAFCAHAILQDSVLIVPDATQDERFRENPLVTGGPQIRFYAGAPLKSPDGYNLGTVCILDTQPRAFGRSAAKTLQDLADIVVDTLELRRATYQLQEEVKERRAAEGRLAELASRDALTGLHNRSVLNEQLEKAVAAARAERPSVLLYLDLDTFKIVNDTLGHGAGDRLLVRVAALLQKHTRPLDLVARFGGDEFAILLRDLSEREALDVAERIRGEMEKFTFSEAGKTFNIGASIGVVTVSDHTTRELLLAHADAACYAAKARGRNRIEVFRQNAEEIQRLREETDVLAMIHEAFRADRLELHLQPVVDLKTRENLACEALARIRRPDGTLLPPAEFLPTAARFGLMDELDRQVVRKSLPLLTTKPDLHIFINLSASAFDSPSSLAHIRDAFSSAGVAAERVVFEIPETEIVRNLSLARELITGLRAAGFRFALDDFGSGVSNLAYLKTLPLDYLKIDGTFVRSIHEDRVYRGFVKAIVEVAAYLRVKTIAEFVENAESLEVLKQLGVDYGQGYYFAEPYAPEIGHA